jgi:hypothetical protein
LRELYPEMRIFKIPGEWAAVMNMTEWAATAPTLEQLVEKIEERLT